MGNDRTEIAPFLRPLFPSMTADKTSHDWHGFLNAMTGLDIPLDMDNATAFDQWRIKLADMGYPTWDHSPSKIAIIAAKMNSGQVNSVLEAPLSVPGYRAAVSRESLARAWRPST